jgi:hypothetical protein
MVRERRREMAGRKYCFHTPPASTLSDYGLSTQHNCQTISTALNLSYPYFFFNKSSKLL